MTNQQQHKTMAHALRLRLSTPNAPEQAQEQSDDWRTDWQEVLPDLDGTDLDDGDVSTVLDRDYGIHLIDNTVIY